MVKTITIPENFRMPDVHSFRFFTLWRYTLVAAVFVVAIVFPACDDGGEAGETWVGTWSTALQLVEPHNMPPEPGLASNTLRQVVRVSIGGERIRVWLSNEFGEAPLVINAARIAVSAGGSTVDTDADRELRFAGVAGVTLEPGTRAVSDPLAFDLRPGTDIALSLYFGDVPANVTGHPGSRTSSYLQSGNVVDAAELPDAMRAERWYIIGGIDVQALDSAAAVVALGNSITDGRGSGTDRQNRWPDELARRLRSNPGTDHIAVLNKGIGGNCVLRDCLGPAALTRFDRDVLDEPGVQWLIILHGINDIGQAQGDDAAVIAENLIGAYTQMIERAHARDIRVYGATLLPFGGSFYDSPEREDARLYINDWIRTGGRFDAVIDLDAALRDPANLSRLLPEADTGDHLHPNETGYRMIAEAIDLALFTEGRDR
jgi:lysophospholipase L1-like esterase